MQTHQINVSRARDMAPEIRRELLQFPEVLDVYVTGRPDWLVVVLQGRPRPAEWLRALRAVGYHVPARRHATQTVEADRQGTPGPARAPAWDTTARTRACGQLPPRAPTSPALTPAVPAG